MVETKTLRLKVKVSTLFFKLTFYMECFLFLEFCLMIMSVQSLQ